MALGAGCAAIDSIDVSRPPGPQQQTRSSGVWRPNDGTDGQWDRQTDRLTDGPTLDHYIDPAPQTMQEVSNQSTVYNV